MMGPHSRWSDVGQGASNVTECLGCRDLGPCEGPHPPCSQRGGAFRKPCHVSLMGHSSRLFPTSSSSSPWTLQDSAHGAPLWLRISNTGVFSFAISLITTPCSLSSPNVYPSTCRVQRATLPCSPLWYLRLMKGDTWQPFVPQNSLDFEDFFTTGITRGLLFPVKSITLQLSLWKQPPISNAAFKNGSGPAFLTAPLGLWLMPVNWTLWQQTSKIYS